MQNSPVGGERELKVLSCSIRVVCGSSGLHCHIDESVGFGTICLKSLVFFLSCPCGMTGAFLETHA